MESAGSDRVIVWFRNDLRLDDNEVLCEALKHGRVIPVYVFDDRLYQGSTRDFGFRKTGPHRAKFLLESVEDLRLRLRALGSDLVVRSGLPELILPQLCGELHCSWVYCNRERTDEEVRIQDKVEAALWGIGRELRYERGKMLYYTADLPFPVSHTPDIFTQFRKEVERFVEVREPLEAPNELPPLPEAAVAGALPNMTDFGYGDYVRDDRAAIAHRGGETAGLARLSDYLWGTDAAKTYKETRNGLLGPDYSTKFSAWLAAGCLSPKRIYAELKRYEAERGANDSTYWIYFELLWRDFFRLMIKKHGNSVFSEGGPKAVERHDWNEYRPNFDAWAAGLTGIPFVDANMKEINGTGFMSNRGRQNVASYLVKDLKVNWQMGAEYFESQLIDYDVASNWCNWNYVAGVGSDPRADRYFNVVSQAQRYDPQGAYVKHWLPTLSAVPAERVHEPWKLSTAQQGQFDVRLGVEYPNPVAKPSRGGKPAEGAKGRRNRRSRGRQFGVAGVEY